MLSPQALFLLFCIPARIGLVIAALRLPPQYLTLFATALLLIGCVFMYLYITDSRLDAVEAGGQGTWWHQLRPIHGLLYLLAGGLLLTGHREEAAVALGADVALGFGAHVHRYWF